MTTTAATTKGNAPTPSPAATVQPIQVTINTVRVAAKQTANTINKAVEELSRSAAAAIKQSNK